MLLQIEGCIIVPDIDTIAAGNFLPFVCCGKEKSLLENTYLKTWEEVSEMILWNQL